LDGRVAIITGGASGIGAATTRLFVENGARVVVADLQEVLGSTLAKELAPNVVFQRTDVSNEDDIRAAGASVEKSFGRLDCIYNNAGFGGALLVVAGGYTVIAGLHAPEETVPATDRIGRLIVTGLALSVDNLVVGFALGTMHVSFIVAAAVIAAVSVAMSLAGLELGGRLGSGFEHRSEVVGGAVLVLVGLALAIGLLG